jgi:GTP cyclohydrolase II
MPSHHNLDIEAELSVLDALTAPTTTIGPQLPQRLQKPSHEFKRRDSDLDPLLLAAVSSSGPHVTRNHYAHDFFPAVGDPRAPGAWDWTKWTGEDANSKQTPVKASYTSLQAPRRERLKAMGIPADEGVDSLQDKENTTRPALTHVENIPLPERAHYGYLLIL